MRLPTNIFDFFRAELRIAFSFTLRYTMQTNRKGKGMSTSKVSTSIRLTPACKTLVEAMATELGVTQTAVIEMAVREKAKREKIDARTGKELQTNER